MHLARTIDESAPTAIDRADAGNGARTATVQIVSTSSPGPLVRSLRSVDEVIALYQRWGNQLYDDLVSQLDHGLQCAALADDAGAHDELIVASLLHDLGHLIELDQADGQMGDLTIDRRHESIAVRALAGLYPPSVTAPIALHVEAKRYLCAVDPTYHSLLSEGSVRSLATQGGPMSADEVTRFQSLPAQQAACDLRRWDDLGKVEGLTVAPFQHYMGMLRSLAVR
jgi:phosphonate degradation associated HDIG domain protein